MIMQCPTCQTENPAGATACSSCGTPLSNTASAVATLSMTLPKGASLQNGAFKVGEVLGQGGFGITYKGGDMKLKRYVAIKEFFPQGSVRNTTQVQPTGSMTQASFNEGKAKFIEEARTLAKFNHPNIVKVFDAFEENNTAYMTMELLNGKTLQSILDGQRVLSEKSAIHVITQVGKALDIVHQEGLLHRDIKPENIVLTKDRRVVLIDFGTAREFTADKTKTMTAMLTPGYAPLEQYGSQSKYGPYTDLYALSATLYHCITGQLPVFATDRAVGVELTPPELVNSYIPQRLSRVIMWAMDMDISKRPQSAEIFLDALHGKIPPNNVTISLNTPRIQKSKDGELPSLNGNRIITDAPLEHLKLCIQDELNLSKYVDVSFKAVSNRFTARKSLGKVLSFSRKAGDFVRKSSRFTIQFSACSNGKQEVIISCREARIRKGVLDSICQRLQKKGYTAEINLNGINSQAKSVEWYCIVNNQQLGPMTQDKIIEMATTGEITQNTMVWRHGRIDWEELRWTELIKPFNEAMQG